MQPTYHEVALAIDDNWLAVMERKVSVSPVILVCIFLGVMAVMA